MGTSYANGSEVAAIVGMVKKLLEITHVVGTGTGTGSNNDSNSKSNSKSNSESSRHSRSGKSGGGGGGAEKQEKWEDGEGEGISVGIITPYLEQKRRLEGSIVLFYFDLFVPGFRNHCTVPK